MAYHIATFVLLPHVLRIKRYMSSQCTVQHQVLISILTTAQCHDADISTNQLHWPPHAGFGIV